MAQKQLWFGSYKSREKKVFIYPGLGMIAHKHTSIYLFGLDLHVPVDCTILPDGSVEPKQVMRYENETKSEPQTYWELLVKSTVRGNLLSECSSIRRRDSPTES